MINTTRYYKQVSLIFLVFHAVTLVAQDQASFRGKNFSKQFATKDTLFSKPYVDIDEWRDKPAHHRYVHGGFAGTETLFSFYFPTKEKYDGHFFQYITPTPDNETLSQNAVTAESDKIRFSIESGAYFIETNGGGARAMQSDNTISAFRANAASADFSRVIAIKLYGGKRPFGYAFGGSGGSLRTIGSIENTKGVWDGVVPYVMPTTMSLPNAMTSVVLAQRMLHNKLPAIVDALEVGSNKTVDDVLTTPEEKSAYKELTSMGFPTGAWKELDPDPSDIGAFAVIYPVVRMVDGAYFSDFWTKPGYEGSTPSASLNSAKIEFKTKIVKVITAEDASSMGLSFDAFTNETRGLAANSWKSLLDQGGDKNVPVAIQLEQSPAKKTNAYDLTIETGELAGKPLSIHRFEGDIIILQPSSRSDAAKLKVGDALKLDNLNFLAVSYYHRHQMPGEDFDGWKQYRNADGKSMYAERPVILGPMMVQATSGSQLRGNFEGKMILLQNMYDGGAFPWNAYWYQSRVKKNLGDKMDQNFRLYFSDHANHGDYPYQTDSTHTVVYLGILQQALRDLSAWVEKGIDPPSGTSYKVQDAQVILPSSAKERKGIQPVITVKADGKDRSEIKAGQKVILTATIEVPASAGKVVSVEWNFGDTKEFTRVQDFQQSYTDASGAKVTLTTTHVYSTSGTFFPTVRAASQREGNNHTPFTRIQNLGNARVVVK